MIKSWTCPFCKRPTTITSEDRKSADVQCIIDSKSGKVGTLVSYIVCPNTECKKLSLSVSLFSLKSNPQAYGYVLDSLKEIWHLIPDSTARVYSTKIVPKAIVMDYEEACKIKTLSPKASATLSRRALQTMIRNYWNIKDRYTLKQEIDSIKDKVTPKVWKAINAVRKIGNIGAHMEKDVNLMIDVKPNEAEKLIWLVEFLIERWYIEDYEVDLKLGEIIDIENNIETQKKQKIIEVSN